MEQNISIPQCNPKANYLKYKTEIDSAVSRVLDNGYYILGPEVEAFEDEFAFEFDLEIDLERGEVRLGGNSHV